MSNPIFLPPKKITRGTLLAPDGTLMPASLKENAGWLVKLKPAIAGSRAKL
ncbi:hypothetical protein [Microcoleus sp. FACHB-68]|uniref:hypothetical protein n=1 Tax=Microcoleus sp. FACHB-68 TaxID=2692826 RepID=UPI0016820B74|nr:hypothetical protein [Microcoleus sp. FACHB-68]MBD1936829.1 hypothetical protein [Microcoleus sp. FACHB-68]